MQRDFVESLLRSGIIEAKAGQKATARRYLERAIDLGSDHAVLAEAWYWMSLLAQEPSARRAMLENCLSHDMRHARARRELAVLDGRLKPEEIIDPDRLATLPRQAARAGLERIMCPQCGARMHYAPDGETLVCDFCTTGQSLASQEQTEEQDFLIAMATARGHRAPIAVHTCHCQGCGAEYLMPAEAFTFTCAYCASPHVVNLEKARELIQPEGIIPHAMTTDEARRLMEAWCEKERIALAKSLDNPRGFYLPVWTFDLGGSIAYSGYALETEHEFGGRSTKTVRVQDQYAIHVDDLPVPASRNTAPHLARLLPSFDLRATQPYDARFLANWAAEVYSVPMADASLDARGQAYARLKRSLPGHITALHNLSTSSAKMTIESFKLVLLPVWLTEIEVSGETELLLLNGQTGAVAGPARSARQSSMLDWLIDILDD